MKFPDFLKPVLVEEDEDQMRLDPIFDEILDRFETPYRRVLECYNDSAMIEDDRVIWYAEHPFCSKECVNEYKADQLRRMGK